MPKGSNLKKVTEDELVAAAAQIAAGKKVLLRYAAQQLPKANGRRRKVRRVKAKHITPETPAKRVVRRRPAPLPEADAE